MGRSALARDAVTSSEQEHRAARGGLPQWDTGWGCFRTPGTTGADRSPQRRCHRAVGQTRGSRRSPPGPRGWGCAGRAAVIRRSRGQAGSALTWREGLAQQRSAQTCCCVRTAVAALCRRASTSTVHLWASCALASQKERQPEGAVGAGCPRTTNGFMSMRCRGRPGRRPPDTAFGQFDHLLLHLRRRGRSRGTTPTLTPSSPARSSSLVLRVPL